MTTGPVSGAGNSVETALNIAAMVYMGWTQSIIIQGVPDFPPPPPGAVVANLGPNIVPFVPQHDTLSTPIANFTAELLADRHVRFTDRSLNGPGIQLWNFGDGKTASSQFGSTVYHRYSAVGDYTVTLKAQNHGGVSQVAQDLTITDVERYADFSSAVGGYRVWLSWAGNFVPNAEAVLWNFGDGTIGVGLSVIHEYQASGTYEITVSAAGYSFQGNVTIDTGLVLSWQDNSGDEDGFRVYRSIDGESWTLVKTVGVGVTSTTLTLAGDGVDTSEAAYYKVVAYNSNGESDPTNTVLCQCAGVGA